MRVSGSPWSRAGRARSRGGCPGRTPPLPRLKRLGGGHRLNAPASRTVDLQLDNFPVNQVQIRAHGCAVAIACSCREHGARSPTLLHEVDGRASAPAVRDHMKSVDLGHRSTRDGWRGSAQEHADEVLFPLMEGSICRANQITRLQATLRGGSESRLWGMTIVFQGRGVNRPRANMPNLRREWPTPAERAPEELDLSLLRRRSTRKIRRPRPMTLGPRSLARREVCPHIQHPPGEADEAEDARDQGCG